MKNYIDETYLKGFVPELAKYLWTGETNYDKQKEKAEQIVLNDVLSRGYKAYLLRTPLTLRDSGTATGTSSETGETSIEDIALRLRLAYTIVTLTTPVTITFQGSNDDDTWSTIQTITPLVTASETTVVIGQAFKYYRVNKSGAGTVDYSAYLVDTVCDLFFAYKWLELILLNASTEKEDTYDLKRQYFADKYNELWDTAKIFEDTDETGILNDDEGETRVTFSV